METLERMIALFTEEQDVLRSRDMRGLAALTERKHLLTKAYEDATATMRLDIAGFQALPTQTKARLKALAQRFRVAAEENAHLLQAATSVSQSVLNVVVNSINRHRNAANAYGTRRGGYAPVAHRRAIPMPPMSVNRCL